MTDDRTNAVEIGRERARSYRALPVAEVQRRMRLDNEAARLVAAQERSEGRTLGHAEGLARVYEVADQMDAGVAP